MKFVFYFLTALVLLIISCSGSNEGNDLKGNSDFKNGVVNNKITCDKDTSFSYALYLPSDYLAEKKYPVVFVFDPHAAGSHPLEMYKDIAEEFDFILIGSNSTENGMGPEELKKAIDAVYVDAVSKLSIEPSQIYALGFSGGAKVASVFAANYKVNTVIGCGGGIADVNARINYDFIGIAGTRDFNFLELISLNQHLTMNKISNEFIMFDGKHEWPKKNIMKQVFVLLSNKHMRSAQKDENRVKSNYSFILAEADSLNVNNNPLDAYIFLQRFISSFETLSDVPELKSKISEINTESLQDIQQKLNNYLVEEIKLQQDYVSAFQNKDAVWWKSELERIKKLESDSDNAFKSQMYSRLISYMSIVAYSYSNNALKNNQLKEAEKFLLIYKAVDPDNPDVYFFYAKMFAMKNENEKAAMYYGQAVDLWKAKKMKILKDPLIDEALKKSE